MKKITTLLIFLLIRLTGFSQYPFFTYSIWKIDQYGHFLPLTSEYSTAQLQQVYNASGDICYMQMYFLQQETQGIFSYILEQGIFSTDDHILYRYNYNDSLFNSIVIKEDTLVDTGEKYQYGEKEGSIFSFANNKSVDIFIDKDVSLAANLGIYHQTKDLLHGFAGIRIFLENYQIVFKLEETGLSYGTNKFFDQPIKGKGQQGTFSIVQWLIQYF